MNREFLDQVLSANSSDVPVGLLCRYCTKILLDPQQLNYGHRYCKECLFKDDRQSMFCLICNVDRNEIHSDYAASREIKDYTFKCPMRDCIFRGKLDRLQEHLADCFPAVDTIPNSPSFTSVDIDPVSSTKDLEEELREMKSKIDILIEKSNQIEEIKMVCKVLRETFEESSKDNRENMKCLMEETDRRFKDIENLIGRTSYHTEDFGSDIDTVDGTAIWKEVNSLRKSYITMKEDISSRKKFNKKIKTDLDELNSKIKTIDNEMKLQVKELSEKNEYLVNELSAIKTKNEKKVIRFYDNLSGSSEKLKNVSYKLPKLYKNINIFKERYADVLVKSKGQRFPEGDDFEKQVSEIEVEIAMFKEDVDYLLKNYPESVFISVFFEDGIGMNVLLSELEIFGQQFESNMMNIKKNRLGRMNICRSTEINDRKFLRRRPAFTMSDRRRTSDKSDIDEV